MVEPTRNDEQGGNSNEDKNEEEIEQDGLDEVSMFSALAVGTSRFESVHKTELSFIDLMVDKHLRKYITRRSDDLFALRIRFREDQWIPSSLTDEQLIIYLFSMQYNVRRAESLLRSNYKLRFSFPNLFSSRIVTDGQIQALWGVLKIAVFPKKTHNHQHTIYFGLRDADSSNFRPHEALKLFFMCADVYHIIEGIPCAINVILDAEDSSYGYFTKENYQHLKIVLKYVQESMPYNVECIHIINSSSTIQRLFRLIKPFLTKDIINSVFFHREKNLSNALQARVLPTELGGTASGTIDEYQERFRQKIERMQEFFNMEEDQRSSHYIRQTLSV